MVTHLISRLFEVMCSLIVPLEPARVRVVARRRWTMGTLALLIAFLPVAQVTASAAQTALPTGVPDIFDPEVRALFQPVGVANLGGNPDFPVLIVVNKTGEQPQAMLLALDARNGKDTWSLGSDPVILIALFSDPTTIQGVYVDAGFATQGQPSGTYLPLNDSTSLTLPDLLKAVTAVAVQTYM